MKNAQRVLKIKLNWIKIIKIPTIGFNNIVMWYSDIKHSGKQKWIINHFWQG